MNICDVISILVIIVSLICILFGGGEGRLRNTCMEQAIYVTSPIELTKDCYTQFLKDVHATGYPYSIMLSTDPKEQNWNRFILQKREANHASATKSYEELLDSLGKELEIYQKFLALMRQQQQKPVIHVEPPSVQYETTYVGKIPVSSTTRATTSSTSTTKTTTNNEQQKANLIAI